MNNILIRLADVCKRTALSRSTIYLFIQQGTFPKQVKLGVRSVAWRSSDVDAWIDSRRSV